MTDPIERGKEDNMQAKIEDVPGTKKWGNFENPKEGHEEQERRFDEQRQVDPPDPKEVYESAERAKAEFASAAGASPELTEEQQDMPPEQREAREKVAREMAEENR